MNLQMSSNPESIAKLGEKIYEERYKAQYEAEHLGKFVAINIKDGHATLGETSEEALERARRIDPTGIFHLIRVGSLGAFRVSYASHASDSRLHWSIRQSLHQDQDSWNIPRFSSRI